MGRFLALVGDYEEATTTLCLALDELEQLNSDTPGNALVETDLLRSHSALARLLSTWKPVEDRDVEQALDHARTAVERPGGPHEGEPYGASHFATRMNRLLDQY